MGNIDHRTQDARNSILRIPGLLLGGIGGYCLLFCLPVTFCLVDPFRDEAPVSYHIVLTNNWTLCSFCLFVLRRTGCFLYVSHNGRLVLVGLLWWAQCFVIPYRLFFVVLRLLS